MHAIQRVPGWILLGALLLTSPAVVMGQVPRPGEHVLVTYSTDQNGPLVYQYVRRVELEVIAVNADHILGRYHGSVMAIDLESIRRMKRQVGTKPASAPAMVIGSAGGFAVGFLFGAVAHSSSSGGSRSAVDDGLSRGVLLGAPAGALVAWLASRSRPLYEEIDINRIRLLPRIIGDASGGVALSLSIPTR